jgi:hypothetical protein
MRTILTQSGRVAQEIRDRERVERLEGADPARMTGALTFLIGFDGDMFDTIMDAVDPEPDHSDLDLEPVCSVCDQALGIFMTRGPEWQHYRGTGPFQLNHIEILAADHDPVLVWRLPEQSGTGQ